MQKPQLLYLTTFLFLFLAACSNDDDNSTGSGSVDRTPNLQITGSSANDFLSASFFNRLEIEVLYEVGAQPQTASLNSLTTFLSDRLNKPGGISISTTSLSNQNQDNYSLDEIVDIETEQRTHYNQGNIIKIFIFFANGSSDNDNSNNNLTLGAAYRNTSLVVYHSTLQGIQEQSGIAMSNLESATLFHEMGHLLGLVNLGSIPQSDHEDSENPNHCNVNNCLMEAQIAFGGGMMGSIIPELDAQCIADLQANGGK